MLLGVMIDLRSTRGLPCLVAGVALAAYSVPAGRLARGVEEVVTTEGAGKRAICFHDGSRARV